MADDKFRPGKICPTCGSDDFTSEAGMKSHHKRVHGKRIAGVIVECDYCGSEKRTQPSRAETNEHHFCDETCEGAWRSIKFSGRGGPGWTGGRETVQCHQCGADVKRYRREIEIAQRNFCDADCRGQWRSENWEIQDLPRWNGGPLSISCHQCGVIFQRKRSQVGQADRQFCGRECFGIWRSEFQRGSNNPSWAGGTVIRKAVRNQIGNAPWRDVATDFRGPNCELCGTPETSDNRALSIHHIVPIMAGGTNEGELLMTLCNGCHRKVEAYTRQFVEPVSTDFCL